MQVIDFSRQRNVASYTLKLAHGKELSLDSPQIMGILNLAPDSFSHVGRYQAVDAAVEHACQMVEDGAAIIDIGAEPTNPSLDANTSLETELNRLMPVLEKLVPLIDVPISIDSSKPDVFTAAINAGAHLINDVRGLRLPGAIEAAAKLAAGVCLLHMSYPDGVPESRETAHINPNWERDINSFLRDRVDACITAGIDSQRIMLDPGIGFGSFGKSTAQNCRLLSNLDFMQDIGFPLLIGASRKTFIGDILSVPAEERLAGSLSAAVIAALQGAHVIRVHDVKPTIDAIKIAQAIVNERGML